MVLIFALINVPLDIKIVLTIKHVSMIIVHIIFIKMMGKVVVVIGVHMDFKIMVMVHAQMHQLIARIKIILIMD